MIFVGIIVSILIFSIIVLVHEYGHFKASRIFGVKVEEFGLGIPPRAKKLFYDKHGTLFSLNRLPLGGFVKLTGEQPHSFLVYDTKKKLYNNADLEKRIKAGKKIYDKSGKELSSTIADSILEKLKENRADYNLGNKPAWQQLIIILAGVFMNFLLATIVFSILFFVGVKPIGINTQIETDRTMRIIPTPEQAVELGIIERIPGAILNPVTGSIAEQAGILPGDVAVSVNNIPVQDAGDLLNLISQNPDTEIEIEIKRESADMDSCGICETPGLCAPCPNPENTIIQITPSSEAKIGSYLGDNIIVNQDFEFKYGFVDSVKYGALETYNHSILTFRAIGTLVRKLLRPETKVERQEAIDQVSGPIGIVDFISSVLENGVVFLIIVGAIISINLGVFNLLPIPALDGGRAIFIILNATIKKLFGRKAINDQVESLIHVGFFIFLILLSILIAYNDILKIYSN